ncbi:putative multidrug resistance protein [Dichanthelium oligosanthes]|uniref:Putative multidrug resistance protein n=1 Tax=Dichanthelium oligosanthes TaxID=888268 RepID=A0A1E5UKZ0_9POAL|nr:putative multidrug resistance protein [Dichanthelium oligosanthes]
MASLPREMGKDGLPETGKTKAATVVRSLASVFMHADAVDVALMVLGLVGAVGDGMSTPMMLFLANRIFNDIGSGPDRLQQFTSKMNENARNILYLAVGNFVMAFLEGYCWTRTAERQASQMRLRYLRAVLRQDVEYFDLKAGSTSEVITAVSNDSLLVQDVLSEKLPNFVMNCSMFLGGYVVGFALLWQLTLVMLPSVPLLVVPGFLYGRVLIGPARRIREQYTRPGAIAEQAVSSVRTVYSFVAETSTMAQFSAALEESTRLGIKGGLAKGVAIGSSGISFAIYAFSVWHCSRLVMYYGYKGGTVYAVSTAIIIGGTALGSALSNVKYVRNN